MKCPSCGETMPDNREYCQYCGWQLTNDSVHDAIDSEYKSESTGISEQENHQSITSNDSAEINDQQNNQSFNSSDSVEINDQQSSQSAMIESTEETTKPIKKKFCKYCGGLIDQSTKKCTACGKQFFVFPVKNALFVICAISITAAFIIIFYQRVTFSEKERSLQSELSEKSQSITSLESSNKTKDSTIDSLNSQISSLKDQVTDYKQDSETLSSIISFLQNKNTGSASSKFKASDKIFVVDRFDTQTSFILTCDFPGFTNILTSKKGSSADIIFSQDRWYGSTTKLFINPSSVGTTVITFSNDQNTQTFKIMIIVTN